MEDSPNRFLASQDSIESLPLTYHHGTQCGNRLRHIRPSVQTKFPSPAYNPAMPQSISFQGCSLSFYEQGAGDPVVFIQGVGLDGEGWRPQTDVLQMAYRCLIFDNRGMGASQPLTGKLTLEQMATDTLAVMDAAGIASAHLVGHSLGGCIAQQVALAFPSRVKSLALLCTSARGADATDLRWPLFWVGLRCHVGTAAMRRRAFLEIVMSRKYRATHDADKTAAELAPLFGHDLATSPPGVMKQLGALKTFDARARLAELAKFPVLVLSAEEDIIFPPRCGRALAQGIPGARHVEVANAAHGVPMEYAERVNRELESHLQSARESQVL
jgi:pimeloyl-ACP methyl ester carboxylesterase